VIPQLVTVRVVRPGGRRPIRLWIPVLLVAVIFAPLLIVIALAAVVACLVYDINVPRVFRAGWQLMTALPGTRVDIAEGTTAVFVSIH
jgi:hypothetical protein